MSNTFDHNSGPLHRIVDPVVAAELRKLWSIQQARGGQTGSGGKAYVTFDDLKNERDTILSLVKPATKPASVTAGGVTTTSSFGDIRPLDNQWTGSNLWQGEHEDSAVLYEPQYGTLRLFRRDTLPVNPGVGEIGNAFHETEYFGDDYLPVVPTHHHGISSGAHKGNVWGIATEAYNAVNKQGRASPSQLFGSETSIINHVWDSTAWRNAGIMIAFKNRLDIWDMPANALPLPGYSYNKNTAGVYIVSGRRIGSATSPDTGNASIECGFNYGIYFDASSLDTAAGQKATGIDFTALDSDAPEGGKHKARVGSALAVADDMYITFSTNKLSAQQRWRNTTGHMQFENNGSQRVAFNLTSGTIFCFDGVNGQENRWYVDPAGSQPGIMRVRSGSRMVAPNNSTAVSNWVRIVVDNINYSIPLYR
jgi:hypothetical protein